VVSLREGAGRRAGTATAWVILTTAGLLEIVWATALKHSDGFTRVWPSVLAITAAFVSFIMLSMALRSLPVGTAYAVWVGIGAVGVAVAGIVVLGETVTVQRVVFLSLIVGGIAGLRAVEDDRRARRSSRDSAG
jgi:quaternary ammonium compound-resistance protein SugE